MKGKKEWKAEVKKKKINIYDKRNDFSLQQKQSGSCCISNLKTKRVEKFRTLETDGELSYISSAMW